MDDVDREILEALREWDPIEVGYDLAESEYAEYVSILRQIAVRKTQADVFATLIKILVDYIGLDYEPENGEHSRAITSAVKAIVSACHNEK